MRGVTLSDGRFLRIGVQHNESDGAPLMFTINRKGREVDVRGTRVRVSSDDGVNAEAVATCSPNDNFSKAEGRRIAVTKLLRNELRFYSKEDKRKVFENVCPEFVQS